MQVPFPHLKISTLTTAYLVALSTEGSGRITGAVLTAKAAGQLPVIPLTLVTAKTKDVRQTSTLAGDWVTVT